jgi:hypothetical protein
LSRASRLDAAIWAAGHARVHRGARPGARQAGKKRRTQGERQRGVSLGGSAWRLGAGKYVCVVRSTATLVMRLTLDAEGGVAEGCARWDGGGGARTACALGGPIELWLLVAVSWGREQ